MESITSELNYQRKAHRITIPIQISIDNVNYDVIDWSTTGLRIEDKEGVLKNNIQIDDKKTAYIILPTGNSSVTLKLQIRLKNADKLGFEISEMDEKNRRVLRHYATMSIEGNGERIEDLMSDLFMVNVQTPIKEPIALTESEAKEVHLSFVKKAILYSVSTFFLIVLICSTLIYNYVVIYHDYGLTTGNTQSYMALQKGELLDLYVDKGSIVTPDLLLYQIDSKNTESELKAEYEHLASLKRKLYLNKKILIDSQYSGIVVRGKEEREAYEKELVEQQKTLARAKKLYDQRLITLSHYNDANEKFLLFMGKYNQHLEDDMSVFDYKNESYDLQKKINISQIKIDNLKRNMQDYTAVSKHKGIVHSIKLQEGAYLDVGDEVLVLETDEKPYLLTKLVDTDAISIEVGQPCLIYSEQKNKKYKGYVTGIGYSVTNSSTKTITEVSQNEIPVRIEFADDDLRFHVNHRMEVFVLRNSIFLDSVYDTLLWD